MEFNNLNFTIPKDFSCSDTYAPKCSPFIAEYSKLIFKNCVFNYSNDNGSDTVAFIKSRHSLIYFDGCKFNGQSYSLTSCFDNTASSAFENACEYENDSIHLKDNDSLYYVFE